MADGTHQCETVMWFEDIHDVENYQHYVVLPPGVPAIKITSKSEHFSQNLRFLRNDAILAGLAHLCNRYINQRCL